MFLFSYTIFFSVRFSWIFASHTYFFHILSNTFPLIILFRVFIMPFLSLIVYIVLIHSLRSTLFTFPNNSFFFFFFCIIQVLLSFFPHTIYRSFQWFLLPYFCLHCLLSFVLFLKHFIELFLSRIPLMAFFPQFFLSLPLISSFTLFKCLSTCIIFFLQSYSSYTSSHRVSPEFLS